MDELIHLWSLPHLEQTARAWSSRLLEEACMYALADIVLVKIA